MGFGANLVVVPVVAVVEPAAVPVVPMLGAAPGRRPWPSRAPTRTAGRWRWLMVGRLPGTLVGAVVALVAADTLSVLCGGGRAGGGGLAS